MRNFKLSNKSAKNWATRSLWIVYTNTQIYQHSKKKLLRKFVFGMNLRLEGQQWIQLLMHFWAARKKKKKILNPQQGRTKLKIPRHGSSRVCVQIGKDTESDFWESGFPSSLLLVQNQPIPWDRAPPSGLHIPLYLYDMQNFLWDVWSFSKEASTAASVKRKLCRGGRKSSL